MNFSGLTDFPERAGQDHARCRCGSLARVASGLCVSCLLRSGLDAGEPATEDFDALLAAVDIPDRDWQLGNYRVLEEIGRGGMGVIYRARHTPSRRIVALKRVLNYHSDSRETLARFQREATAAASLLPPESGGHSTRYRIPMSSRVRAALAPRLPSVPIVLLTGREFFTVI